MSESASFGYMQARIHARHGDRLTPDQWSQLDACRDLGRFLQLARSSGLDRWVRHFAAHEDPAQWETSLRADWRSNLSQVSDWVPQRWRTTITWLNSLPALPAIGHVMNGEAPPDWMARDPFFEAYDLSGVDAFRESLDESAWSPLLGSWRPERPVASWVSAWRTTWPRCGEADLRGLENACIAVAKSWHEPDADDAQWRESLERTFTVFLRRHPRTILAMLGHIGLVSVDMLHLRAGLLRLYVTSGRAETAP